MTNTKEELQEQKEEEKAFRKSGQALLPASKPNNGISNKGYDIYPVFHVPGNQIFEGVDSLADYCLAQKTIIIDGYVGIFWEDIQNRLTEIFEEKKVRFQIRMTSEWFLSEQEISRLVNPYLGEKGSVWGTRCDYELEDFFNKESIHQCQSDADADINIILGPGAALSGWKVPIIYFDLPKNELQYRMRAGRATNLGSQQIESSSAMYKRFYFVDWPVLNKHKKRLINQITIIADGQRPDSITWMHAQEMKTALSIMSENVFRVRPWFEPGAWGGQWMKNNIRGLNPDEINYAWSFELITPENGLILESNNRLLEISFDFLMFLHAKEVLGEKGYNRFMDEFPIRFDFLDTIRGGNLSIQCHPSPSYIKENFGENFTQDETYYILEAEQDAGVYLGFQENIEPQKFRKELEQSNRESKPVEIKDHVQYFKAQKHDLFLIPNGTIHSAGAGNLVLEISATPYIFTFKMYDWLRLDLNGQPRPINIEHAFNNLNFERKGEKVIRELISQPLLLEEGKGWKLFHLPTHPEHFYDIHRYEFEKEVEVTTEGSCQVLMLVEGSSVLVKTKNGYSQQFYYAETWVIPAAAEAYTIINEGNEPAKVVKAFLKNSI